MQPVVTRNNTRQGRHSEHRERYTYGFYVANATKNDIDFCSPPLRQKKKKG